MNLQYQHGDPTENGVYACRVDHSFMSGLMEDIFLLWYDGKWTHLGSDQGFQGDVWWIGPLPRKISQCPAYICPGICGREMPREHIGSGLPANPGG